MNNHLLYDFEQFGKQIHAKIVHRKCLKMGKLELAKRITKQYKIDPFNKSDVSIAFELAIKSMQNENFK